MLGRCMEARGIPAGWDGFSDMTHCINPVDNYLGDFAPDEPRMIAQVVQDFRNDLGNPGWFTVALTLSYRISFLTTRPCYLVSDSDLYV
jgi:hypothetical protein